jgi:hypothetical protein
MNNSAYADKSFEGAANAPVVSNPALTIGARQCTASKGVSLLHHDEPTQLALKILSPDAMFAAARTLA